MNPIGWCDKTVNVVFGCSHGCDYCYAKRLAPRVGANTKCPDCAAFKPHWHPERFKQLLVGKDKRIFIDSMGDLFDPMLAGDAYKYSLLIEAADRSRNTLVALTKRPNCAAAALSGLPILPNFWLLTSIESQAAADERVPQLLECDAAVKGVSIEPLLGPIELKPSWLKRLSWIIVGAQTGPKAVTPEREWLTSIVGDATLYDVPIFVKSNAIACFPDFKAIQEFPKGGAR